MILILTQDEAHLNNADLIELLDGECHREREQLMRHHLAACPRCCTRADRLAELADGFSTALLQTDDPAIAPGRRRRDARLPARPPKARSRKAAMIAGVVVLLALVFSVTPARAWVVAGWQVVKSVFVPAQQEPVETSAVSFAASEPLFSVDVERVQARGMLSVVLDSGQAATARVFDGDGRDEVIVLPSGLRVRNRAESVASYELRLPSSLETIEVRVGGELVSRYTVTPATTRARWTVDLARRGAGR